MDPGRVTQPVLQISRSCVQNPSVQLIYATRTGMKPPRSARHAKRAGSIFLSIAYDVGWSAAIIFIVVIGGIGTIEGPIIGTIVYFLLRETLLDYGTWYLIALGVVAIVAMVKYPSGVWGTLAERFDICLVPVQRSIEKR
jgi:hypothetical protein